VLWALLEKPWEKEAARRIGVFYPAASPTAAFRNGVYSLKSHFPCGPLPAGGQGSSQGFSADLEGQEWENGKT